MTMEVIVMRYVLLSLLLSTIAVFSVLRTTASGDEGPGFDPNGRPYLLGATTDEGNGADPHG